MKVNDHPACTHPKVKMQLYDSNTRATKKLLSIFLKPSGYQKGSGRGYRI
jgi:hypothetical protein